MYIHIYANVQISAYTYISTRKKRRNESTHIYTYTYISMSNISVYAYYISLYVGISTVGGWDQGSIGLGRRSAANGTRDRVQELSVRFMHQKASQLLLYPSISTYIIWGV